jgi:hypothetical protein
MDPVVVLPLPGLDDRNGTAPWVAPATATVCGQDMVAAVFPGTIGPARQGRGRVRRCLRAHVQGVHGRKGGLSAPVQLDAEHDVADGIGVAAMVHTVTVSRGRFVDSPSVLKAKGWRCSGEVPQ